MAKNVVQCARAFFFTVLLSFSDLGIAKSGDIKIIANPNVRTSEISSDELRRIFLVTETSLTDGVHVEPVLQRGGATHELFVKHYVGKTDSTLVTYYRSLVFTGKGLMPKTFTSDAEVAAYVARTKGAIGYVGSETELAGIKTLQVTDVK